jgi:hypothetical protein
MTTTTAPVPSAEVSTGASRPGRGRRTAVALAALVSCALPVSFAVTITGMLVTGTEPDHRFHQVTGQGLVLVALWLGALLPLVRAGWRGERPSTAAGYRHLALVAVGLAASALSAGGGARELMAVVTVPGILLWAALPLRPRLRGRVVLDPVFAPLALVLAAVLLPYAVDQLALQVATTSGYHAENPHLFDMAWVTAVLAVLALVGAAVREARGLLTWVGGACSVIGAAGLVLGEPLVWSAATLVLGVVTIVVANLGPARNRP